MESSSSKVVIMKPVLLKAGIPLAISLAGFVVARIVARKSCTLLMASSSSSQRQETGSSVEDDHALESSAVDDSCELQEEILELRSRIEEMRDRELGLEKRFLRYQDLKDHETVLMELQNKLMLEMNRVEFMGREISTLEAENQRFDAAAVEYLRVLRLLEFSRSENGQLHKRVEKLSRTTKRQSWILRKQNLQIMSKETEISRNRKELEAKADCIRLLENEMKKLKLSTEQLQGEKNEVSDKLRAAEESAISKAEGEMVSIESYNQLACELERLQRDEAAEVEELIYLRWCNACLRHELMRRNQEQERMEDDRQMENNLGGIVEIEDLGSDNEVSRSIVGHGDSYFGFMNRNHAHSRRRKLLAKFKRWVEGSEKEKHGNKCFRRRSASDGVEELYLAGRNSCSSA
ncbi:protein CHUP1, chloroplastic [Sesamum angolense]|uniref:Protein CHUP1, chloroplastic n=1 Tax=Sesamum angolense TaxID=2727404 RepID=A0AAE2BSS8_9LAMI|nr:protein CHUP1, chloroplastic [Sesamum angolense]